MNADDAWHMAAWAALAILADGATTAAVLSSPRGIEANAVATSIVMVTPAVAIAVSAAICLLPLALAATHAATFPRVVYLTCFAVAAIRAFAIVQNAWNLGRLALG
jgi:hypothetical protein